MKISFYLKIKGQKVSDQEPFEVPYLYEGNLCSVIVYGSLNQPQVLVESLEEKKQLPLTSKYWFFIRISWSRVDGFKFCQYSDPGTTTSLSSTTGSLRGRDKIELGNNLATIIFKAEVNQEDLDTIDQTVFLEKCSEFGIRVVDTKFSNLKAVVDGLSCANCQLVNVEFSEAQLQGVDFSGSYLNQVKFLNSNLNRANFTNSQLAKVEFYQCYFIEATFDNCRTLYSKQRIENNEILIFNNCDFTGSSFKQALLCSKFEDGNLSNADFSLAKFVACKFYDCNLSNTIFSYSQFKAFGTQTDKNKKQNDSNNELINCYIGVKPGFSSQEKKTYNTTISKCKFDGALMDLIEISENTTIIESNFEATSLYKSKLRNCKFIQTNFTGKAMKSANLSSADISGSTFENCYLNEVNLFRVKMIEGKFNNSELVRASLCNGNLRGSKFLNSDLTGVDFRYADLTLLNIDKCLLNCANFFQTQRGGINLNISNEQNDSEKLLKTSCTISCIDWSPKRDGEIQISKEAFLDIIQGKQSAVAVITNLSKEGASYIFNTYANANAKSAENLNDSSVNTQGEVSESSFDTGNIETDSNEEVEQDEDNTLENNATISNDSSDEENE
ncbi:MAG: pentapeptide repeat-containing protein, partial [Okeania sp. SIO3B3]|nr:pentapeptide repeat-containing protein [Okeania sp. SIO3B3]